MDEAVSGAVLQSIADSRVAKKSDWNNLPMPEQRKTLELNIQCSSMSMQLIKHGTIPEEMEDKWFMYYEKEESKLYCHRSWTGFCTFIVQFVEDVETGGGTAVSVVVNRNEEQYRSISDDDDVQNVSDIIKFVLGAYD